VCEKEKKKKREGGREAVCERRCTCV
jgi:hypothetical protein